MTTAWLLATPVLAAAPLWVAGCGDDGGGDASMDSGVADASGDAGPSDVDGASLDGGGVDAEPADGGGDDGGPPVLVIGLRTGASPSTGPRPFSSR